MNTYILPLILISGSIFSSNGEGPLGARSAALGHASSTLRDVWSTHNNQGSIGFLRQTEAGAFCENRFFLKELTRSGFATVVPVKKGSFGLCYSSIGYKLYRESQLSLSYGIRLSEHISAGIAFDYLNTKIADIYGHGQAFTGSFGLTAKLLPQLTIATHIYNPFRVKMTNYNNEKVPTIFKTGVQYMFTQKVFLMAEAEKTSAQPINIKAGIEYIPVKTVYIRAGGCSYPTQAAFGIGINYKGLKIDLSSMYHSVLGLSPQVGLSYAFGKEKANVSGTMTSEQEKL